MEHDSADLQGFPAGSAEGELQPGDYEVLFGYMVDGQLIYSEEPLHIRVRD